LPTYEQLCAKHPQYDGKFWKRCRALYSGGKRLLHDPEVLHDVFPRHLAEEEYVYKERCRRAYYIPYPGEIIDAISAALFSEKLTVSADPEPDEFYAEFFGDCSKPGGKRQSVPELMKEQLITALLCKRAWTLVDLPEPTEVVDNYKEQEKSGLLDAYACTLDPECVWDWEEDEEGSGELEWVLIHYQSARRNGIEAGRDMIKEEWIYYDRTGWKRYKVEYKKDHPPKEKQEIPLDGEGLHSFGRVPIVPFELPDGLWAMGKIESIAVAHLNKRNALTWAEYKSLFPVLTHMQGEENPLIPVTGDPNRGTNQVYGIGRVMTFGAGDELKYVGPDAAPFMAAMQDLNNLRDEMHRVLHQMAMSVDNSGAALQRSGDSKQVDQEITSIILRALGQFVRDHVRQVYDMVQVGRKDQEVEWEISGMEKFNEISVGALVDQAAILDTLSIPAPTFQRKWRFMLAKRLLGDNASEEEILQIQKELDNNISDEQYDPDELLKAKAANIMGEPGKPGSPVVDVKAMEQEAKMQQMAAKKAPPKAKAKK